MGTSVIECFQMGKIHLDKIEKWFGSLQVIKGVDLDIHDGELVIFVGPSGCGKSTLLRLICGLEEASRGKIFIDGEDVTALPPSGRELSMVFQSYALYPHMSVRENMGFGLKTAREPKAEIKRKVDNAAETLQLTEYLDRRPKELSGGQRQRVAIGRAIVREPKAFLFDEPLSNLDAALRVEMRFEIAKLHQALGATMIYVTHDQVEAMTLADRIVVLQSGVIEQVGTPLDLYQSPRNLFVAQFIGSPKMNVMDCSFENNAVQLLGHGTIPLKIENLTTSPVKLGVRPEHITITSVGDSASSCQGTVEVAEHLGADTFAYITAPELGILTVRAPGLSPIKPGDKVGLIFPADQIHLFDKESFAIKIN